MDSPSRPLKATPEPNPWERPKSRPNICALCAVRFGPALAYHQQTRSDDLSSVLVVQTRRHKIGQQHLPISSKGHHREVQVICKETPRTLNADGHTSTADIYIVTPLFTIKTIKPIPDPSSVAR